MELDVENLPTSPQLLQEMVLSLHDKLNELIPYKEKYVRLLEELHLDKQRFYGPSSEKDILQRGMFDEAGVELSEEVKAQLEEEIEVKGHTRKKHPVRRPLPKYLPREIIVHDLPEAEKTCHCGAHLIKIGEAITEQLKYVPAQLSVVQHVRPKYACKPCQENIKIAPVPILFLPKSIAAPELVAYTIVAKYCDHLPLYRQESIWGRLEIDLPRSSLCGWIVKTAELCQPLIKLLQKNIIDYGYAQADETTVQVLDEVGRDNTQKSYMWCYRGGPKEKPSIVFDYQETRGGYHAKQFLTGFKGHLQTDAYGGYNFAEGDANIIAVGCNTHARRPFAELVKLSKSKGLADEAIKFYQKLYAIEEEARKNNLSPDARYKLRQNKAPPILNAFKEWLDYHLTKTPEQSKLGKAMRYCIAHWSKLTNYLKDGRIEIDNNLIENAIRALKRALFYIH